MSFPRNIQDMNNFVLKNEYLATYQSIHVIGNYGAGDIIWLDALEKEMGRRGIKIHMTPSFSEGE